MNFIDKIRNRIQRESFCPSVLGYFFSPDYMIRRALYRAILGMAPRISGYILDFGCGSKPYQDLFAHATGYVGVDLQITGHDHRDSKVDVFYDGQRLPFADEQFDSVISFEVFEHIFNLPQILGEICRVTKPLGHLLISIPFAWNEHEVPYDYARYTSFGIAHLLRESGYEVVQARKTTSHLVAVGQMWIVYLAQLAPKQRLLRNLFQLAAIAPVTAATTALDKLLPRKDSYYCNSVILARKVGDVTQKQ